MLLFKKILLGLFTLVFIVGLGMLFKVGIEYSTVEKDKNIVSGTKRKVSKEVDKIVDEMVHSMSETKENGDRYLVGSFVNKTNVTLPKVKLHYNIVNKQGNVLKESYLELKNIKVGEAREVKIPVNGYFDYTFGIEASSDLNL